MPSKFASKQPKGLRKKPIEFWHAKGFAPKKRMEKCSNCGDERPAYYDYPAKCRCGGAYQTFGVISHFRKDDWYGNQ